MITEPTALILGAGASMPYGFPSNLELMREILIKIRPGQSTELSQKLTDIFDIEQDDIDYLYESLSRSGKLSVDAFLEHQPGLLRIGKLAITLTLVQYEIEDRLFNLKMVGKSWYEYLWNRLDAPFYDFDKNKLSIITFNYDRSLEQYLITAMKNLYGKSEKQCAERLSKIPIIHVHGRLGNLVWQGEISRPYKPRCYRKVEEISNQIIVIPEQEGTSPEFEEATKLMRVAKNVYFLGFGYHPKNLERLRVADGLGGEPRGTSVGLGNAERSEIKRIWKIRTFDDHSTNLEFLKNYAFIR